MKEKLRVLFCNPSDLWTYPLKETLAKLRTKLNAELFIMSENMEENQTAYISHFRFKSSLSFQKMSDLKLRKYKIPEELLNNQISFRKAKLKHKADKKKIKAELDLLLNQIGIFYELLEPDIVIVWNGHLGLSSFFKYMAERLSIPLFFSEKGLLPESWYIDRNGIGPESLIANKDESFFNVSDKEIRGFKKLIGEIDKKGESAWAQPLRGDLKKLRSDICIDKNKKIIFFPCQVESDTNIILFSDFFKSNISVIKWILRDISNDYFLLVKTHPKGFDNKVELETLIGGKGKIVDSLNIIDAISISDIIVTINSTVGFEASIRKKPVLHLGKGIMAGKCFIQQYNSNESCLSQIEKSIKIYNRNSERYYNYAIRFGTFLYYHYYIYRNSAKKISERINEITKGFIPKKKKLLYDEVSILFSKISYLDLSKFVSGRTILKGLVHKVTRTIIHNKYIISGKKRVKTIIFLCKRK